MKFSHAVLVVLILHVIAVAGIFAFNSIKASQTVETRQPAPSKSTPTEPAPAAETRSSAAAAAPVAKPQAAPSQTETGDGRTHTIQAGDTLTRVATLYGVTVVALEKENAITSYSTLRVGQVLKIPQSSSGAKASASTEARPIAVAPSKPAASGTISSVTKPAAASPAVPAATAKPAVPTAPVKSSPAAEASSGEFYVVVKGDNPYSIAKRLHVSYTDLLAVNHIDDPKKVQIGQKLKIPQKTN